MGEDYRTSHHSKKKTAHVGAPAAVNPSCTPGDQIATYVEGQVLDTLKAAMGWPEQASGILTPGGSVGNLVGLAAARDRALTGREPTKLGLGAAPQLVLYASGGVHKSVEEAAQILGIGSAYLRRIPMDSSWRMDCSALQAGIEADLEVGLRPFCVVATAGTVDHGAIDPLDTVADLCAEKSLWLHVDGGFGALAVFSDELRPLLRGMERADSLAFDLHTWLHVPIEVGCLLVRRPEDHPRLSSPPVPHSKSQDGGVLPAGLPLSRASRSLEAWFTLRTLGTERLGRMIAKNVRQTQQLTELISDCEHFEVVASGPLNVLSFRYRPAGIDGADLDALNAAILVDLLKSDFAMISSTVLQGRLALRLAVTNHRTQSRDAEAFVEKLKKLATTHM